MRPVKRLAKTLVPATAAAAVTAIGFAAFTDDASNAGNSASAASVTITQDVPASTPLFDLKDWQPGEDDTVVRCIAVKNGGSIALPLSLRLDGAPSGELGSFVDMKIERGTRPAATDSADCGGFTGSGTVFDDELADFPTAKADAVSDGGAAVEAGAERAYRITWHLQDDEDAEGKTISGVNFLWETSSAN